MGAVKPAALTPSRLPTESPPVGLGVQREKPLLPGVSGRGYLVPQKQLVASLALPGGAGFASEVFSSGAV